MITIIIYFINNKNSKGAGKEWLMSETALGEQKQAQNHR
jgi:hypothetical protein